MSNEKFSLNDSLKAIKNEPLKSKDELLENFHKRLKSDGVKKNNPLRKGVTPLIYIFSGSLIPLALAILYFLPFGHNESGSQPETLTQAEAKNIIIKKVSTKADFIAKEDIQLEKTPKQFIQIKNKTIFSVREIDSGKLEMKLETGKIAISNNSPQKVQIETSEYAITEIGTVFEIINNDNLFSLEVTEGLVELRSKKTKIKTRVEAGQKFIKNKEWLHGRLFSFKKQETNTTEKKTQTSAVIQEKKLPPFSPKIPEGAFWSQINKNVAAYYKKDAHQVTFLNKHQTGTLSTNVLNLEPSFKVTDFRMENDKLFGFSSGQYAYVADSKGHAFYLKSGYIKAKNLITTSHGFVTANTRGEIIFFDTEGKYSSSVNTGKAFLEQGKKQENFWLLKNLDNQVVKVALAEKLVFNSKELEIFNMQDLHVKGEEVYLKDNQIEFKQLK